MVEGIRLLKRILVNRTRYYIKRALFINIKAGKRFYPKSSLHIARGFKVRLGDDVFIGRSAHIACNLEIKNDVLVASRVSFVGGDHKIDNIGDMLIRESGRSDNLTTVIENNAWIGQGCIVISGVRMKSGSVLAAGSVLTKDIGENEIWGGVPAKFIRLRKL